MLIRGKKYIIIAVIFFLFLCTLILLQKEIDTKTAKVTLLLFLILFSFMSYLAYKINTLYKITKNKLAQSEALQLKQINMHKQLIKYNQSLEDEISIKIKEIHSKRYTNILTGLPNRSKLLEDLMFKEFSKMALLNIDNFKALNDVYGEEMGNVTLKITAVFIQKHTENKNLSLYHVGGDEFAIVANKTNNLSRQEFIKMIEKLLQDYIDEDFSYRDKKLNLMISSGITFSGKKKMLAYADMALKNAKKRNLQLSVFDNDKEIEKLHKDDMESHKKLLHALQNNTLISYFQPIIPLKDTTKPIKYESLVRIKQANGNILQPFSFLDIAKTNRIYYKITEAVLTNTLNAALKYKIPCSLNISFSDIDDEATMKMFFLALNKYQHNDLITIELLETEDFIDYDAVYKFCLKVRSYGIKIALDDFGSGYSNFTHILKLPVDYIKIDASLISSIAQDNNSRLMVETIVELAHKLGIETIAEFVSSSEILNIVKEIGIDYAQGFHIGKPQPIENLLSA